MNIIKQAAAAQFKVKGSKFMGFLFPISSDIEYNERLSAIRENHLKATHYCSAFRRLESEITEYSDDDGEPSGTAGLPMLNAVRSAQLVNTGAVVVRYFGGTKLGKSGLIDAYRAGVEQCIQKTAYVCVIPAVKYRITYEYRHESAISQLYNTFKIQEIDADYRQNIYKLLLCPQKMQSAFEQELARLRHFNIKAEICGTNHFIQP